MTLDWVCEEIKPFSFVESEYIRKHSSLDPICRNTFHEIKESSYP